MSSLCRESLNQRQSDCAPRTLFTSRRHPQSDTDSMTMLKASMADGKPGRLQSLVHGELVYPLVDREEPAHTEEEKGHDEGPEVDGPAVPQRVLRRRREL